MVKCTPKVFSLTFGVHFIPITTSFLCLLYMQCHYIFSCHIVRFIVFASILIFEYCFYLYLIVGLAVKRNFYVRRLQSLYFCCTLLHAVKGKIACTMD